MPAITSLDLSNAKLDVDHIAAIATSTSPTATDRLGNTKNTVTGAINTMKAFNPRGAFVTATAYAYKDLYTASGVVYLTVLAHTSTNIAADLAAGKIVIYKGLTEDDLIQIRKMQGIVGLENYSTLKDAIADLPSTGGVVEVPVGRFKSGVWKFDSNYMAKDNVTIRGVQMPKVSANCDRLVGGSIIEGRFNAFANNFCVENIGFDCGKYVIDTYFGGLDTHTANHPYGDTWDGFAFAQPSQSSPLPQRTGFSATNIIGLNRDSQSVGHAVLMEGFSGGFIDNVIGIGGIHGLVIKASNVSAGYVAGYSASTDHVIIKSDSYAPGFNIKIAMLDTNQVFPGTTPWFTPAQCSYGLFINPATNNMSSIKIGIARLFGAVKPLIAFGPVDGSGNPIYSLDNFKMESTEVDATGFSSTVGASFTSLIFNRCSIDTMTLNNVTNGVIYQQTASSGGFAASPLLIGSLRLAGTIAEKSIWCSLYGRIVIDNVFCDANTGVLYYIENTARINVGRESISGFAAEKFGNNPPTLTANWEQYPGNSSFRVILANYGVMMTGYLRPLSGGSGNICTLPAYLKTAQATRRLTYSQGTGSVDKSILVNVDPSYGYLAINNGSNNVGAEMALSLDGVSWILD